LLTMLEGLRPACRRQTGSCLHGIRTVTERLLSLIAVGLQGSEAADRAQTWRCVRLASRLHPVVVSGPSGYGTAAAVVVRRNGYALDSIVTSGVKCRQPKAAGDCPSVVLARFGYRQADAGTQLCIVQATGAHCGFRPACQSDDGLRRSSRASCEHYVCDRSNMLCAIRMFAKCAIASV
jgi:hypothetical protein